MSVDPETFAPWLARWDLTPDGEAFRTGYVGNLLLPVRQAGVPAMLKLATSQYEIDGGALMAWWAGEGAARVLAREGEALLLERLEGSRSLAAMAREGRDDQATRIICLVADALHAPRATSPPVSLRPLDTWLRALELGAAAHGGVLRDSLAEAQALLADPRDIAVLHGDLHHENVLDGGQRGWLAIDPKGLWGERTYEFATTLCNPDEATAVRPGRLARQVGVVADAAQLEPRRVLRWVLAHAGVSAVWCVNDGFDPGPALQIAEIARGVLSSEGAS